MKRKILCLLLCLVMMVPQALAVDLYLDGRKLEPDVEPCIIDGRTLVPVRIILESLGADVLWDDATRTVTAKKDGTTIVLQIDNTTGYVNNEAKSLDVPAKIINGRTMVPVRFVSESLNAYVWWEGDTETVYVSTKPEYNGYTQTPDEIFYTNAEENGLSEVAMFADGYVSDMRNVSGYDTFTLITSSGKISISNAANFSSYYNLQEYDYVRICYLYVDRMNAFGGYPSGIYVETGDWSEPITYPGIALIPENPSQSPDPAPPSPEPVTPAPAPTPAPTPAPEPDPQGQSVYVTKTGKRYHYSKSCAGKNATLSTIDAAMSRGLTGCKKCT